MFVFNKMRVGTLLCIPLCGLLPIALGSSSWEDSTATAGLSDVEGITVAFGDLNADRHTDLFFVNGNVVSVAFSDGDSGETFEVSETINCTVAGSGGSATPIIHNVVATDMNNDGRLDVVVTYTEADTTAIWLCLGSADANGFSNSSVVDTNGTDISGQPAVLDYNGDGFNDFLVQSPTNGRGVLLYKSSDPDSLVSEPTYVFSSQSEVNATTTEALPAISVPHSNAFVDLNGDCLADLVVTTKEGIEFWLNIPGEGISSATRTLLKLPVGVLYTNLGQLSFDDIDSDGAMDIVVPVCTVSDSVCTTSQVLILYNSATIDRDSRCQAASNWGFGKRYTLQVLADVNFVPYKPGDTNSPPIALRTGCLDFDGFPDAVGVAIVSASGKKSLVLFMNQDCEDIPGINQNTMNVCDRRGFLPVIEPVVSDVTDPIVGAFFDYEENIILDLVVIAQSTTGTVIPRILKQSLVNDAFFVKVTVLNGVDMNADPLPYGVNTIGAAVGLQFVDIYGQDQTRIAAQQSLTCYQSLQTGYSVIGLGRTTNYIDDLTTAIAYTGNGVINSQTWNAVLPNSQLVIAPYQPDQPVDWTMKLFLVPNNVVLWVSLSLVVGCCVLTILYLLLHFREKWEDEQEKRRTDHLFNFNAM
ncbi:hypothetical protein SARC_03992 [Sphaeroforma arctica JP610]|uniref:T-cell immunomodulatory protein TIP C2 domain-containing protein n=1 Tax=Sphaeroforma arctica JP610 TaxID=667725 RepID=A0A0L0G6C4_9EUKA|nr:hypothetical protein SARC_03992 [Sphaeroforma arctica JP610]KNC83768.1 hypothetical protein SARC_03992 [Sphaeroforma arctica JP610]|eukprot:XP_014157670.1 hypothetical protein SARC_03992 [Sphaeroforma arctica JP610]